MALLWPTIELILMDSTGSTAVVSIHCDAGSTVEEIDAAASALASIVLSITGCVLVRQRIQYKFVVDIPTSAAIGSSIKRCGVFIFEDASGDNQELVQLPGIISDVLHTSGPGTGILIELFDSRVVAFLEALSDAGDVNPFAVECGSIVTAYRQSRV